MTMSIKVKILNADKGDNVNINNVNNVAEDDNYDCFGWKPYDVEDTDFDNDEEQHVKDDNGSNVQQQTTQDCLELEAIIIHKDLTNDQKRKIENRLEPQSKRPKTSCNWVRY